MECDPTLDNGVPCVCIYSYSIVVSTVEFLVFTGCVVYFFVASRKIKKKVEGTTYVLIALFMTAFLLHYVFLIYSYSGPMGCRKIYPGTSYVCFAP